MSIGKISVELQAVVGRFIRDFGEATKAIDGLESKLQSIGKAGGIAAAGFGVLAAVGVKAASDFEQTGNLIERAFGVEGAKGIENFAASLSSDLGTALQETRQGLVSIGMQLKNSLGDATAAETQAKAITKLAADISAAMNIPFDDTLQRIQSGLRGETEAIEKLNIFIGENSLKTEALNRGMRQSVETMSEAQKTALRLSAIYRQTADVQGAAAAEAGTFAGQLARLDADVKNLTRELGAALLPMALELVKGTRELVNAFRSLSPEAQKVAVGVAGVGAAAGGALFVVSSFVGALGTIAPIAKAAWAALVPLGIAIKTAMQAFLYGSGAQGLIAAGTATLSLGTIAANTATLLKALAATFAPLVAVVGAFTAAYGATSVLMSAMGADVLPENVSLIEELGTAFSDATESANGFKRVLINLISALTADGKLLGLTNGGLAAWAMEGSEAETVAESMADAFFALTDADKEAINATVDLGNATDGLVNSMTGLDVPLAGTAEAIAWQKKKTDEAKKAAKAYSEALKDQRDQVRDLEDAFAELNDTTGRTALVNKANKDRAQAVALAKKTGGPEAAVELNAALSLIADNLAIDLAKLDKEIAQSKATAKQAFAGFEQDAKGVIDGFAQSMPGLASVVDDTKKRFEEINDAAREGEISAQRVQQAVDEQRKATTLVIAEMLHAAEVQDKVTGTTSDAFEKTRAAAKELGIEFDEVVKAARRHRRFNEVQGTLGNSIGDTVARGLYDGLASIGKSDEFGKGVAELIGGSLDSVVAGNGIDGAGIGSIVGAVGGLISGISPQVGAQVGSVIGGFAEDALNGLTAGFQTAMNSIVDLVMSDARGAATVEAIGSAVGAGVAVSGPLGPLAALAGAFAAMTGVTAVLVKETEGYAQAQATISEIFDGLVDVVEPFGEQFAVLAQLLKQFATMLTPFIAVFSDGEAVGKLMFIMFQQLAIAAGMAALNTAELVNGFAWATSGILDAVSWLVDGIARFLDWIDGTTGANDGSVDALRDLRDNLRATSDAVAQIGGIDTEAIKEGLDAVKDATWQSAKDQARADARRRAREAALEREAEEAAVSRDKLQQALNNITSDFKIAYQRFSAADAVVPSTAGRIGGINGVAAAVRGSIQINNMTVVANDPTAFMQRLERMQERAELASTGARRGRIPQRGQGRNES